MKKIVTFLLLYILTCFCYTDEKSTDYYKQLINSQKPVVATIQAGGNAWFIQLGDINGDGVNEVIYACYDGSVCVQDKNSKKILWRYDTGEFIYDVTAGDINGDGKAEIFVVSANGNLFALDGKGALLWKYKTTLSLFQISIVKLKDGARIVCGGLDKKVYIFNIKGEPITTIEHTRMIKTLAAGDLDGDGDEEIAFSDDIGILQVYKVSPVEKLWQKHLKRGDKKENPYDSGASAYFIPQTMELVDINNDRKAEFLIGTRGMGKGNEVRVLSNNGDFLWENDRLYNKERDYYYSFNKVVAYSISKEEKLIISKNPRYLAVLDIYGNLISEARTTGITFTDICTGTDKNGPEIFISSSPNGDDQIYRIVLGKNWETLFSSLQRQGNIKNISDSIESIKEKILSYTPSDRVIRKTIHGIGGTSDPRKLFPRGMIEAWEKKFPFEGLTFVYGVNIASNQGFPEYNPPFVVSKDLPEGNVDWFQKHVQHLIETRKKEVCCVSPSEMQQIMKKFEDNKKHFFVSNWAHSSIPELSVEDAENIIKACPEYLLGVNLTAESWAGYPMNEIFEYYLEKFCYPVLDICKKYNKKTIFLEKNNFWVAIPAMERFRKLFDGRYADVLLPSVEDSDSRAPELNLSGRVGLYMTGKVKSWVARTIEDELAWDFQWLYTFPESGHPFLRRQMVQALLGATYFMPSVPVIEKGKEYPTFNTYGKEYMETLLLLLAKGLLLPPKPDEMLNISPVVIKMREPTDAFQMEGMHQLAGSDEDRDSPFEGLARCWAMTTPRESYIGSYLMGVKRHFGTYIPATPYGFVVIVPSFITMEEIPWATDYWETDGSYFYDKSGRKLTGLEAKPLVLESFKKGAEKLPFRAEGYIFMQAQRIGEKKVRITLVSCDFISPKDEKVVLYVQSEKYRKGIKRIVDPLTGEEFKLENNNISLTVPAGVFRILEFYYL